MLKITSNSSREVITGKISNLPICHLAWKKNVTERRILVFLSSRIEYLDTPRNRATEKFPACRRSVFPRGNAYYTYGFPIVSHCRERARERGIPVTIGDRTMGSFRNCGQIALMAAARGKHCSYRTSLFAVKRRAQCTRRRCAERRANDEQ